MSTGPPLAGSRVRLDAPGAEHAHAVVAAPRIAPLVDGVEYYAALRSALIGARRQVIFLGWEVHSEIDLLRGSPAERARKESRWPVRLADLLLALVEARPELHVRMLIWEGASLFALERQHLPRMKRPWAKHDRIDLVWDRATPPLASQHRKIVCVDDRVAFVGGMDVTKSRWDTHLHLARDRRRRRPGLIPTHGNPYHDLMMVVDGDAARALGGLARERWARVTGETIEGPGEVGGDDPWPEGVAPMLEERALAIVLTQPGWDGDEEIRQVEASYLEQIGAAKRLIFIETQYLAYEPLVEALCARLREAGGPEVVIVLPYGCPGRVQSMTMDARRDELLEALREADGEGRLAVYWPTLAGGETEDVHERAVYVHAKAMIVDDTLVRIGSANLNGRSMGLDTECDVFTSVAPEDGAGVAAIAGLRRRLLAYLLHVEVSALEEAERREGSVIRAIESLRGGKRTLHPLDHSCEVLAGAAFLPIELADPDRVMSASDVQRVIGAMEAGRGISERAIKAASVATGVVRRHKWAVAGVLVAVGLVLAWRLTALREMANAEAVSKLLDSVGTAGPVGLVGVTGVFIALGSLGFPVTWLVVGVAAALPVYASIPVCLVGIAATAMIGFAIGAIAPGRRSPSSEKSGKLARVSRLFSERGVLAVAVLRNLPLAPFAVVNVACGMTSLRWWTYLAGTMIGMTPGVVLIALFGKQVGDLIENPTWGGAGKVLGVLVVVVLLAALADRAIRRWWPGARGAGASDGGAADGEGR